MANNKNHHFVPQFYLRRFGSNGRVALYNLDSKRHIPQASIAGQCQRAHLYGRDQRVESAPERVNAFETRVLRILCSDRVLQRAA